MLPNQRGNVVNLDYNAKRKSELPTRQRRTIGNVPRTQGQGERRLPPRLVLCCYLGIVLIPWMVIMAVVFAA
jgi:hypothetical protein